MNIETFISCLMIFCGAMVMLLGIAKAKGIVQATSLVPEQHRQQLTNRLRIHRSLMVFFLCGYIIVLLALAFEVQLASQLFISVIFLLGAIFVLMGTVIQSQLLSEIETTFKGLLPICSNCKKIKSDDGYWQQVDQYIVEHTDAQLTHGICQECSDEIYGGQDWYEQDQKDGSIKS